MALLAGDAKRLGMMREFLGPLVRAYPDCISEAIEILIRRPNEVRKVITSGGYLPPEEHGGFLDR